MNSQGGINKVFLLGVISRQPRLHKSVQDGAKICFTLTTREPHQQRGVSVEHTEEHVIKMPEQKVPLALELGQLVHIEGKLKTTTFTDEQLVKHYKTEVLITKLSVIK
ncbi:single-stranded DNA-binding protein [Mucilaginibacter pallidiroseus]|uniref:Single-stranded DNA-binding protein n=1 Tax=Mucilaginibacter pallidiroseus TaxID=2599295 RepID=A0A563UHS6_9SPHI|nr:single-stranded DNA-binding protein [Mucilaginibacter pallidiroseus]TWR30934.1 single-stranded DNA-binding protein [Mucilaginibacter pallidiroseus]